MDFLKNSIVARLGSAMVAISVMALISMLSSVIVAESTHGDAAGINLAGSLRMQSYRIATEIQQYHSAPTSADRQAVQASIEEFERRVQSDTLANVIPDADDHALYHQYQDILSHWQQSLRPTLLAALTDSPQTPSYLGEIERFVGQIDKMVRLLENSTESKIKLLSLIQGVSLFLTILVIFIAMFDIKNNVVLPLRQLVHMAKEASRGNLSYRTRYTSEDELGLLGNAFDNMAAELAKIYQDLEQRVERKTTELKQSNQSLQLLYEASQRLNGNEDICRRLMPILQQLETITPLTNITVSLHEPNQQRRYREIITHRSQRPSTCRDYSCDNCLQPARCTPEQQMNDLSLPILVGQLSFGEFNAEYPADQRLNENQIKLIETLVDHIGASLLLELKAEQQQQMSLMEERAVIARELHDSLAQSLSYLKMQVSRLQLLRKKDSSAAQIDEVVDELKEGLNAAYRQLRELLTTFRLKLDRPGLEPALQRTIKEFSERLGFEVELKYDVLHQTLTPNEEIHVLQIIREALANVVKHAQASAVSVTVEYREGRMRVSVEDNGVGLPQDKNLANHYGLVIMRDRATTLAGELDVSNRPDSGVRVSMSFTPKQDEKASGTPPEPANEIVRV